MVLAVGALAAGVALHLRDPHVEGSWGFCPWLLLTGISCPGCGGLRAVHDLSHGDVVAAASSNLLLLVALPFVAVLWVRSVRNRWSNLGRPLPPLVSRAAVAAAAVLVGVFWVVRNVPAGSWLAP